MTTEIAMQLTLLSDNELIFKAIFHELDNKSINAVLFEFICSRGISKEYIKSRKSLMGGVARDD